jgi:hypothetical protein
MSDLKKQATLVFLLIFLFIKISPDYYRHQYFPVWAKSKSTCMAKIDQTNGFGYLLIKVEKAIADKMDLLKVPAIKFSGISLELFFIATALTLLNYCRNYSLNYPVFYKETYLFQSVLRL